MNMSQIKKSLSSLLKSAFCAFLIASVVFGFSNNAFALDVKAGPIWNNDDAKVKCPIAAAAANGVWNGQWTTTVPGTMSVCGVKAS
ncbi:MAG: mannan-binding lectin [Rhizonema sp. PD38]|nr:mannan-binding lectin [Rhizonema sp. PD38]